MSVFLDAFRGSGVPLAGDPTTSFQTVPLLGLRAGTVVDNCRPMVGDVVKAHFLAINCGERPLELVRSIPEGQERDDQYSAKNSLTLHPGESLEFSIFRSWDAPGDYQLTLAYEARCLGLPFARLAYPAVAVHVQSLETDKLMQWLLWTRAARRQAG